MFGMWSIGIMGINVYLSHILDVVHTSTKEYFLHFAADILISATAGVITYLLAKTINIPDIYLVMVAAIIGHLAARVAYKSILVDIRQFPRDRQNTERVTDDSMFNPLNTTKGN